MGVITRALIFSRRRAPQLALCGISYELKRFNPLRCIRSSSPAAACRLTYHISCQDDSFLSHENWTTGFPFLNLGENGKGDSRSLENYLWQYLQMDLRYFCIGASHGCLAFFDNSYRDTLQLINPSNIDKHNDPWLFFFVQVFRQRCCLSRLDQSRKSKSIVVGNSQFVHNPVFGSSSPIEPITPLPSLTERSPWKLRVSWGNLEAEFSRITNYGPQQIIWSYDTELVKGGKLQGFPCLFVPCHFDFVGEKNAKIAYRSNAHEEGHFRIYEPHELHEPNEDGYFHINYERDEWGEPSDRNSITRPDYIPPRYNQWCGTNDDRISFSPHQWQDPWLCYFLNFPQERRVITRKNTRTMWRGRYLSPDDSRCVGSSKGWLAFVNKYHASFYLFNPLISMDSFSYPFIPLPPIETLPTILLKVSRKMPPNNSRMPKISPENLSVFPLAPLETVGEYRCPVEASFTMSNQISPVPCEELSKSFIKKVVLSSPPSPFPSRGSTANGSDDEPEPPSSCCTAMIMHGYKEESQLAFCRIGDRAWTPLHGPRTCSYVDIMYSSKDHTFYALCETGHVEAWDLSCPSSPKMTLIKSEAPLSTRNRLPLGNLNKRLQLPRKKYLIDCSGELLLVVRYFQSINTDKPHKYENKLTRCFDVFALKYNERTRSERWIQRRDLEGHTLFVGINECISVLAADYPGLKSDSIYYTCIDREIEPNTEGAYELGAYDVKHDVIDTLYMDEFNKIDPHPVWIFPQI